MRKKNIVYSRITKWTMKTAVARVVAESAVKMKALVLPSELARLDEDLRPVRLDVVVAGNGAQPPIELARPLHESLEMRANRLGDPQRFVRAGSEHRQQRPDHKSQQNHERRDRGRRRPPAKPRDRTTRYIG